jgi:hypothetical protein
MPPFESLATYASEVLDSKFKARAGAMLGGTAIVSSTFGAGRVLLLSPHAESTHNDPCKMAPAGLLRMRRIVQRAVGWVGQAPDAPD